MRRFACPFSRPASLLALAVALVSLTGCEKLGLDTPATIAARKDADGKAIGGACRNAMRAIEDCYTLNPKANKAAVYAGWMEMDAYMRDNKLEGTAPKVPRPGASDSTGDGHGEEPSSDKPADKSMDKASDAGKSEPAGKTSGH